VHTFTLIARMSIQGRPPVTNLYSSAIFIGWGCAGICLIVEWIYRNSLATVAGSVVAAATAGIIAHYLSLSGDTMEMMQAVLDTNFWLATHVTTMTLGYSATYIAGAVGLVYLGLYVLPPEAGLKKTVIIGGAGAKPMELGRVLGQIIYGVVCFATLLSFVGTVLGGIWADQSWGRFWGWDPKENGALLIVLWNAIILHARWGGYARERGTMAMAIFGNVITSFSWFGVNMLGVGLHSYGFMDKAFWALSAFVASQLAIMVFALVPARFWSARRAEEPAPAGRKGGSEGASQPV
jgi:cytochrome c-type biogenesis protein CcsB